MELVLPMYNVHPYFFPQKSGQKSVHYAQQNMVTCCIILNTYVSSKIQ